MVNVTSVLPEDAVKVKPCRITPRALTFAVVAKMDGDEGEVIGAGIGYSKCRSKGGLTYGFAAENHGYKDAETIETELSKRLKRMASTRGLKLVDPKVVTRSMRVPKDRYGCCIVAVVYVPFDAEIGQRSLS